MQQSLNMLNQRAIKAALKADWQEAIQINEELLNISPDDTNIQLRLGRAYVQAGDFAKAKKIFKLILDKDPINKIALRNLELAVNQKNEESSDATSKVGLIKEPGTSKDVSFTITDKGVTSNGLSRGDDLELKIVKSGVRVSYTKAGKEVVLGNLDAPLSNKIYEAKNEGANIRAQFVSGTDKNIEMLIKSSLPIFKSRKQETKPYVKKGAIDEDAEE